jgi:hypothetical protein
MSEKSPSLMIKTILGHLQTGVEKLESGALSPEDMELLVEDAKELYERMVILRYKIYETNVLGVKEPVVSASIRQTEIETPIDLFGSIEEPTIAPEPEFEVTFANGESEILDQEASTEQWQEEQEEEEEEEEELILEKEVEQPEEVEQPIIEEDEVVEPIQAVKEHILEDEKEEEPIQEEEEIKEPLHTFEKPIQEEEPFQEKIEGPIQTFEDPIQETEAPTPWEPQFSADQPIWMAEMEANIRDSRSVFPLDSLIGAFTLNEKLQFINELFEGSSDDFSTNIKQLDQLASMDAARNMLAELAQTFNWDTESEIVEDFIYKICRRHAAGA